MSASRSSKRNVVGLDSKDNILYKEVIRIVKEQLSGHSMVNYDEIPTASFFKPLFDTIVKLIQHTVKTGESNSLIIFGPRGSGKSALLRSSLDFIKIKKTTNSEVAIVELNGLIHTDDSIALKDIARQLKLTSLIDEKVVGSFADNMALILETLKTGMVGSQTIIFCLEEFDLFSCHKNQTLLYNLFDVAQSMNTPIIVIGVTCRLDVIELLEKRVKSRFSHRQLHIFPNLSFNDYVATAAYWLTLRETFRECEVKTKWNNFVEKIFKNETVVSALKQNYNFTLNFNSLQKIIWPLIDGIKSTLNLCQKQNRPLVLNDSILSRLQPLVVDAKSIIIRSLSLLELTLIIVMFQHSTIHEGEPFNFQMIYEQYKKLIGNDSDGGLSAIQKFSKPVVSKAFENLEHLELIKAIDNLSSLSSYKGQKDYKSMCLLLKPVQLKDALKIYPSLPTQLSQLASV